MIEKEILRLEHIAKSFSTNQVLKDINLSLNQGEVRALVGENGAGKSTLIKIIAGALEQDSGEIYINGELARFTSPKDGIDAGISVIYQELDLLPDLTVVENLFLGIEKTNKVNCLDKSSMQQLTDEYFHEMNLEIDKFIKVGELPIAKRQMVAITKAVVHEAKILIMDEPSSSLTNKELEVLFTQIRKLKKKNVSVIYITHRLDEIFEACDTVTVLRDGKLIATDQIETVTRSEIVEKMIGRSIDESRLNAGHNLANDIIFEVQNLCYMDQIKSVSFSVRRGEVLGILGLLGSGARVLGELLYGIHKPTAGEILINGDEITKISPSSSLNRSISYVPDERREKGLFMEMDVEKNAVISSLSKFQKSKFLGILNKKELSKIFSDYVKRLNIKIASKKQVVRFLSGGNQQKIMIARNIINDSDIFILSSPTKGIDVGSKFEIYQILLRYALEGKTIIAISQEITELTQICDRIIMMKTGEIFKEYTGDAINQSDIYRDLIEEAEK